MQSRSGTYVLIFQNRKPTIIEVGCWGSLEIEPGFYAYIGSAFGPGGVRARVSRHLRLDKPRRWHVDYLRECAEPVFVWISYDSEHLEHRWAQSLIDMPGMKPIAGFGCTDCKCLSHLFFSVREPGFARFSAVVSGNVEAWVCRDAATANPC